MYNIIVQKIASQTGKDFSVVEQYLKFFDEAGTDIFNLPKTDNQNEELLEDLVTFIDRYNPLMNSPHFEDGVALPQRREKALNQIAVDMNKDLPSVERYWEVFERTAENIKALPKGDEHDN